MGSMNRARRLGPAAVVAMAALLLGACGSTPKGLGKAACPYVRPRLVRLATDLAGNGPPGDIAAVAQDFAAYVETNLPDGGKRKNDQPLVTFSQALTVYVATPTPALRTGLDNATAALQKECHISGY